jgi:hypothetical protein
MGRVIGILGVSVERNISTSLSPVIGRVCTLEDFFHTIAMVEINVDDNAFQMRVLTKRMGSANDDIIEVTVSSAEACRGVMTWGSD